MLLIYSLSLRDNIPILEMLEYEKWHVLELLKNGLWLCPVGKSPPTVDSAIVDPVPTAGMGKQPLWSVSGI